MPEIHRSHLHHKRHIRNFHNTAASIERLRSTDLTEMVPVREQDEFCVDEVPGGDSLAQQLTKCDGSCHGCKLIEEVPFVIGHI